jgi:DNA invertase Pin-like site-specific DNA recombinase
MWTRNRVPPQTGPGLHEELDHAREGDLIVVHTLERLGRTVRDTLNLIHDLAGRGVGVRNLADPIRVDSANPEDPMSQVAVVMLALFGQMERTYAIERAAHARAVAAAKGKRVGRPSVIDPAKLVYAAHLRDQGNQSISEIVEATGITRSSLYRYVPPRPPETLTTENQQDGYEPGVDGDCCTRLQTLSRQNSPAPVPYFRGIQCRRLLKLTPGRRPGL